MNKFAEYLKNYTENKSICILGFGREGKSTYRLIEKYCNPKSVTIADLNPLNNPPENVNIITGENYQKTLDDFDMVFKSPGIVLEKKPADLKCKITSETQVFFEIYREQIIGITGTKGKSTVSSLIYHILKESGKDTYLVGNIGVPVFDIAEDVKKDTIIVCELSCHQLEYMTVSPETAVFLNLYEEHLDHYGTLENYYNAKKNIYLHQEPYDTLLINSDISTGYTQAAYEYTISAENPDADVYVYSGIKEKIHIHASSDTDSINIPTNNIKLLGIHNHHNIAAAYFVTAFHVKHEEIVRAISTFNPLAHRLEYVAEVDGVRYYDDSISTACATAIEALKSVPKPKTVLIGGMDRGIDYMPLIEFLNTCNVSVICMETSGKRIYDTIKNMDFNNPERVYYVQHLEEAVELAHEITPSGTSCVMSPASASYGIFKNFEERGEVFKNLVANLKNK